MIIDPFKLDKVNEFIKWVHINIGRSANVSVDIWWFNHSIKESISYGLWIEDTLNQEFKNIDDLIEIIPMLKEFCILKMNNKEVR